MSYQAQTAVLRHSQQNNLNLYKLLHYLAECADASGAVNPAPSQTTIAKELNVSKRTVRNWMVKLIESGELERTREGKGPGNASAYQIHLPIGDADETKPETKPEENPGVLSGILRELAEMRTEIAQLRADVGELKAERGKPERKPENRKENRKKPERKPEKTGKTLSRSSVHDPYLIRILIRILIQGEPPKPPLPAKNRNRMRMPCGKPLWTWSAGGRRPGGRSAGCAQRTPKTLMIIFGPFSDWSRNATATVSAPGS